jgi:hypothetical protein
MRGRLTRAALPFLLLPLFVASGAVAETSAPPASSLPSPPAPVAPPVAPPPGEPGSPTPPPDPVSGPVVPSEDPGAPPAVGPAPPPELPPQSPAPRVEPSASAGAGAPASRTGFALELGGAFDVSARFPKNDAGREVDEAVDGAAGLGAWIGSRSAVYGLTLERLGLGKDHYGANASGETLNASYLVDTLWLAGRWYFSETRPAFYLSLAAGPALPRVRTTGTRLSTDVLVVPPSSYECSRAGRVGAGIALAAGGEFDVSESWSILGEARFSGHFLSGAADSFSGCAPGTGPTLAGVLRVGLSYRFGG